ncbi:MAG: alpha/beta hydrolase family protein [Armatimonadota bacterium]
MRLRWLLLLGVLLAGLTGAGLAAETPGTGPWDLKTLRKAPAHEEIRTRQETVKNGDGTETLLSISEVYYAGEPWRGRPTRVFAYYARPAEPEEKKLPAMVLVHGGGGTAFAEWARLWAARGYAALAMDLAGKGPDGKPLPDGGPDQTDEWKFQRLKDGVQNAWPYQAVAAVIRGVSLLRARPEVDRSRIGITGISWGGYLTSIVMSLDDRLKAAVPVYGCGYLHENSVWVPILNALPEDERRTWIANFDPGSYLPRCKTPVLWMNGTNDFAYPLDSYQKSYRAVRGPRWLCVTVKMPHSHPDGWARPEIGMFADMHLRPKTLPFTVSPASPPVIRGEKVYTELVGGATIRDGQIHWTTDLDKPWQQRDWKSARARTLGLDGVEAELPKERPCVYFLTLRDLHGAVTSTEHAILE